MCTLRFAFVAVLATVSCVQDTEAPVVHTSFDEGGYVVEGEVPAGTDLAALMADLPPGGFLVVGDPATGEIATVTSTSNALARMASAEFSVSTPAACVDCGDPTCASMQRTVTVSLRHDVGFNGETYTLLPRGSNFTNLVTTPSSFSLNVGAAQAFSTTGTLGTCSAFSFFFDVQGPSRVFVTSTTYRGDFGGAAAADANCQARATAANLGGSWKAWIGDTTLPSTRFADRGPWVRVGDGVKVADNLADIADGNVDIAVNRNELGAAVPAGQAVWTGVLANNTLAAERCTNWTSQIGTGRRGVVMRYNALWTDSGTSNCNTVRALYCFEQ